MDLHATHEAPAHIYGPSHTVCSFSAALGPPPIMFQQQLRTYSCLLVKGCYDCFAVEACRIHRTLRLTQLLSLCHLRACTHMPHPWSILVCHALVCHVLVTCMS